GARRQRGRADRQPAGAIAARLRPDLPVHLAFDAGGALSLDPNRRNVPGKNRRGRRHRADHRAPGSLLHPHLARGRPRTARVARKSEGLMWRQPPRLSHEPSGAPPCHTFPMSRPEPGAARDLIELILGYGLILFILWMPESPQRILSPVALVVTLAIVLGRRPSLDDLGLRRRGLAPSFWILP